MKLKDYKLPCFYIEDIEFKSRNMISQNLIKIKFPSVFQTCSIIIVKQDNILYVVKDSYKYSKLSKEKNLDCVLKHDYYIISSVLLDRLKNIEQNFNVFQGKDKIIIDFD